MASDYIYYIANIVGLNVEVGRKQPWPDILHDIENKNIDVLTCAAITDERSRFLLFTEPHLSFPLVIVSRKDAPFIQGIQSLHGRSLAVIRQNSTIEWLKHDNIDVTPHYVESPMEGLRQVSLGSADVAIENLATATYLIEKYGLTNLKVAAPASYQNYSLSIAIRNDWPELLSIFNKAIAAIPPEKHNEIRQKWIAVRYEHGIGAKDIVKWVLLVCAIATALLAGFYWWNRKLAQEIQERKKAQSEKEKLIVELSAALNEIKTLRGILPICSHCKKIRDDTGAWNQIEHYMTEHSEVEFSHGICQGCAEKLYPEYDLYDEKADPK